MGRIKKDVYLVEGMSCAGCERTIQRVVGNIPGVESAQADLGSATVAVAYDTEKVSIDDIRAAVNKVGYRFVGERPAHGEREGSDEGIS